MNMKRAPNLIIEYDYQRHHNSLIMEKKKEIKAYLHVQWKFPYLLDAASIRNIQREITQASFR